MSLNWSFPVHPGSMANSSENTSLDGNFSIHHCNHIRKWAYFFNLQLCHLQCSIVPQKFDEFNPVFECVLGYQHGF
uniref:Uncharacterized protein n=1 Tax=Ditylenchus dipsaci TaxID=166011 RepID=A0A915DME9_9BILA